MKQPLKVGLFSAGLDTYWIQFDGLLDSLLHCQQEIKTGIEQRCGVTVIDAGMVDNPEKAIDAASLFAREEIDIVYLFVATYALSATVLPIVQRLNCPLIVLNLQPSPAIDYDYLNSLDDRGKMTGIWLAYCQSCAIPEIASVLRRTGFRFDIVSGYLQEDFVWKEISAWTEAARVYKALKNNNVGILGHYYCGMLDVYTDLTKLSGVFGSHFEMLEMCEMKKIRDEVSLTEIDSKIVEFRKEFDIVTECNSLEIERSARTSVALDKLVKEHNLGSIAYYFEGCSGNDYENIITSIIAGNTLLTGKNIPVAGECEIKNVHAMKILSEFGAGGSFSEFYAIDYNEDIVLLGHDGPAHFAIAEGQVKLVPLPVYHGKPGKGLSIQMSVKHGDITLLSVCEDNESVYLLVAEGESVPGKVLQIGNTNSRYRFACGARNFINQWSKAGPSHHCAVGIGHIADKIEKLAFMLNIKVIRI
jgi:L-arabinose isomerase